MVSRVSRSLSVKISRTVAMALGAVALSPDAQKDLDLGQRETHVLQLLDPLDALDPYPGTCGSRLGPHRWIEQTQLLIEVYGSDGLSRSTRYITNFE